MVGNLVPLVLLPLVSPVWGGGRVTEYRISCFLGSLVPWEEEPAPPELLLFESDIAKTRVIGGEEEKKRLEGTMIMN